MIALIIYVYINNTASMYLLPIIAVGFDATLLDIYLS